MDTSQMDMKEKQSAYHDWEAGNYDAKFSISYDQRCIDYARDRFLKAVPGGLRYERVLEVGAGTGFFIINLWQAGFIGGDVHATDISERMLQVCKRNAAEHGLELVTTQGDAESLPYPDDRFDLVVGHAFLHHLPDPEAAIREMRRVLAPGGTLVIAGEPTRWGDAILRRIKRATYLGWRGLTALPPLQRFRPDEGEAATDGPGDETDPDDAALAALEWEVDLHAFDPGEVEEIARRVGLTDVRVTTEDLTASWFGWAVRTIEGSTAPDALGERWAFWAYRNYLRLQRIDDAMLSRVVPRGLFYNLILHAREPTRTGR